MSKDTRRAYERMEVQPSRYTPITDTDEGDTAAKVMLGLTLFVLVLVVAILRGMP